MSQTGEHGSSFFPKLRRTPLFRERRRLRMGGAGGTLMAWGASGALATLVFAGTLGAWFWPAFLLAVVAFIVGATFTIDLEVMPTEVRVVWWGRIVRRRLPIRDIDKVEVVVAESGVFFFGGYSSRSSFEGALVAGAEGDRSVGNKAVRLSTEAGSVLQVGCWRPTRFQEALKETGEVRPGLASPE